jgi:uncharacterized integral membrane protein
MSGQIGPRRWIMPLLLGGMLAVIVGAALTPNVGVVNAQSNCQYGSCSQGQEPTIPLDYVLLGIVVVETGILIAALAVLFRRRGGSGGPRDEPPEPPA